MIFQHLLLGNFGSFRGIHKILLTPPSKDRPIVLFGGMNGAGKTTVLDAIHLSLFGRQAQTSSRGGVSYEEYLRRSIHRDAPLDEESQVELEFSVLSSSQQKTIRVNRSWSVLGNRVREKLSVFEDGLFSVELAERWSEFIEEIVPLEISTLFFFDGEKIESLANPESTSKVVESAIKSLLGLNVLEKLRSDLTVVERRKLALRPKSELGAQFEKAQSRLLDLEKKRSAAVQDRAAVQNEVDRALVLKQKTETKFEKEGGAVFEQRVALEAERRLIFELLSANGRDLLDQCAGSFPLYMLGNELNQVLAQCERERNASEARILTSILEERDKELLSRLEEAPHLLKVAQQFLEEDRLERGRLAMESSFLKLSEGSFQRLGHLVISGLEENAKAALKMTEDGVVLQRRLDEVERKLAAVPTEDAIKSLLLERQEVENENERWTSQLAQSNSHLEEIERALRVATEELERLEKQLAGDLLAEEEARRVIEHSSRARQLLDEFLKRLLEHNVRKIEESVFNSFRVLLRKMDLVQELKIDLNSFEMALVDHNGEQITTERLSAGERQLLAVALLWGLAQISGRVLPTVVDTPLGRLDSAHRQLLVRNYFPRASHQVLLLSTDEEIDPHQLSVISTSIGRTYLLNYDETSRCSSVSEGYFWEVPDVA